jgi:hypothetical protein
MTGSIASHGVIFPPRLLLEESHLDTTSICGFPQLAAAWQAVDEQTATRPASEQMEPRSVCFSVPHQTRRGLLLPRSHIRDVEPALKWKHLDRFDHARKTTNEHPMHE